ncbi:hypothetical protein FIBSPDRAFT_853115 [Athelia psychrophila]|uniref:Uncharacterized protein n=1 Tax=Athelia psychrophila TaxID=1759441 RepID=A0A166R5F2_9AGAM|nr:hypothetical protein FIBSPDRAFT_853115 [Fibularhizoctonia sp. CBS 109695]
MPAPATTPTSTRFPLRTTLPARGATTKLSIFITLSTAIVSAFTTMPLSVKTAGCSSTIFPSAVRRRVLRHYGLRG